MLDIKLLLWMEILLMLEVHLQVEQLIVNNHPFFKKRELEKVKEKLDELEQKLVREKNELLKLENDAKELAHTLLQKQMSYAKLEVVVQGKKEELVVAKGEYESLSHQSVELDEFKSGKIDNQLVLQLNEAIKHRDELTEK